MPPSASSKRPRLTAVAPVKAPFSCPNISLSSSVSDRAAQLTATKAPSLRRLARCTACAATSLPVPLSPRSSTVASVTATFFIWSSTASIAGSCATTPVSLVAHGPHALVLLAQPAPLERAAHHQAQLVRPGQRLAKIVEGAQLHGLDRALDGAVRGQHDDLHLGLLGAHPAQQRHAVQARHLEIGQHQVERLAREQARRGLAVGRLHHAQALALQHLGDEAADSFLVVDDQDAFHDHSFPGAPCLRQGKDTRKTAPPSAWLLALMRPP